MTYCRFVLLPNFTVTMFIFVPVSSFVKAHAENDKFQISDNFADDDAGKPQHWRALGWTVC